MHSRATLTVALLVLASSSPSRSLAAQIPERFENLQVLPKDIPRDSLVSVMRGFAGALGVRCTFCHVENPGNPPGGLNLDFKSDSNEHKRIARFMLRMVDTLNLAVLPRIPDRDDPPTDVRCVTCHRGLAKPSTIETVLRNAIDRGGVDTAIVRYRALRMDMASGKFNFGEQPVTGVAQTLAAQKRYDDAIALLKMIQEFYPNSPNIDFQLGETYLAKGDREQGIARLRAVLAKNPNDQRVRARLEQLGVTP